jgi:glycosyltransferase involved in cell wall biosynthesis
MRLLYICQDPGIAVFGRKGASTHIREVCRAWLGLGHQVHLVCVEMGPDVDPSLGLPVSTVPAVRRRILGSDLRRVLLNRRFAQRLPVIARDFAPDLIYERHSLYTGAARGLARRRGVPHLLEANALLSDEQRERLHWPALAARSERRAFQSTDCLITVSPGLAATCAQWGVPAERIHTVPMAVDPAHFSPRPRDVELRAKWGWKPEDVVAGYLGALTAWHQPELLLRAVAPIVARHPELRLLFIGGAPQHVALYTEMAKQLGLGDRAVFTGAMPYTQVPAALAELDIGVVPGVHRWSTPTKMFEYGAMRIALVAPRTENIAAVIDDSATGLLFAPNSAESLGAALDRLLADEPLRRRIAEAAHRRVLERHTWRHHADVLLGLCQELVQRRRSDA